MRNTNTKPALRFSEFKEEWKPVKLNEVLKEHKKRNANNEFEEVFSVAKEKGVINQIEHLGRSYASDDISNYKVVYPNDIVYTKSPTASFPFGIIKQNKMDRTGVVSVLYAVFKPKNIELGLLLDFYFSSWINTYNYLVPLVHKGAKNTMNIGNEDFLNGAKIYLPTQKEEQKKITDFFLKIDQRIAQLTEKKQQLEIYKKGITQQLFSQQIRFKDENGKEFPKWEKKKLGEVTFKVGAKNKENKQLPIYSISNKKGFIPQSSQFEGLDSVERGFDISLYKIIYEKTYAYNPARINVGSIGYSGSLNNVLVSSLYVCFQTKEIVFDSFFNQYLDSNEFNKSVLRSTEGGVRQYLFYENFSMININLPSIKEQEKIANFLSSIDEKINHTENQIQQTQTYKKGLLQKMFV
jgi:type I restriction enzyme S subunit